MQSVSWRFGLLANMVRYLVEGEAGAVVRGFFVVGRDWCEI